MLDIHQLTKMREMIECDPRLSNSQKQRIILQITNQMLQLYNIEMTPGKPWVVESIQPIPELESMIDNL